MKKSILLILLPIIFIGCSKSNVDQPTSPTKEQKLMKVEGILTPLKLGKPSESDKFRWSRIEYNSLGNLILSSNRIGVDILDENKSSDDIVRYSYLDGRLYAKEQSSFRYMFEYNGADTAVIYKYGSSGLIETQKIDNLYGKKCRTSTHDASDKIIRYENFGYDPNGLNITIDIYYPPLDVGNQLVYSYDEKGNILTERYLNREKNTNTLQARFGYKYDPSGKIIEYIKSTYDTIEYTKWTNEYDSLGKLLKQNMFRSNNFEGPYQQVAIINYVYTYFD